MSPGIAADSCASSQLSALSASSASASALHRMQLRRPGARRSIALVHLAALWLGVPSARANCTDINSGATDTYGDGCADYVSTPSWCGGYDDSDFTSVAMCCACGGGLTPPMPPPAPAPPYEYLAAPSVPPPVPLYDDDWFYCLRFYEVLRPSFAPNEPRPATVSPPHLLAAHQQHERNRGRALLLLRRA